MSLGNPVKHDTMDDGTNVYQHLAFQRQADDSDYADDADGCWLVGGGGIIKNIYKQTSLY